MSTDPEEAYNASINDEEDCIGEWIERAPLTEERERFEIKDAATANWYLKKLRNLENEKDTIRAQAATMIKALDTEIHALEFRFGKQMETFVRGELDRRGGRSKTLPLFQGTAAFRTVPASLRVRNVTEAIEHARAQGWDAIKTVETLDADRYKKEAAAVRQETGELLPGIEVIQERENFTIKFAVAKDASGGENEQ